MTKKLNLIIIMMSLVFSGCTHAEIFILDLQLASFDSYINSLKYQVPVFNISSVANESTIDASLTNDAIDDGNSIPEEYSVNGTHAHDVIDDFDNDTKTVLDDMYSKDYAFDSNEYSRVKKVW